MKLYDCQTAPSPRRARIFLAEKGLSVEIIQVDLRSGEHLTREFKEINPFCTVPVLELDDGTRLKSTAGIWNYLESFLEEPRLMGRTPIERGIIADLQWHIEMDGFMAMAEFLRNSAPGLKGRALTGPESYEQIPEIAERGKKRLQHFFDSLDELIGKKTYAAGESFSIADIDLLVFIDFAAWKKFKIPENSKNTRRWYENVSNRPSAKI